MNIRQVQKSKASGVKQEQTINVTSDNNNRSDSTPPVVNLLGFILIQLAIILDFFVGIMGILTGHYVKGAVYIVLSLFFFIWQCVDFYRLLKSHKIMSNTVIFLLEKLNDDEE